MSVWYICIYIYFYNSDNRRKHDRNPYALMGQGFKVTQSLWDFAWWDYKGIINRWMYTYQPIWMKKKHHWDDNNLYNCIICSKKCMVKGLFVVILKPPQTQNRKFNLFKYFQVGSDIRSLIYFLLIIKLNFKLRYKL